MTDFGNGGTATCVTGICAGRSGRGALGEADRIGWAEETIGVSDAVDLATASGVICLTESGADVEVAVFLFGGFLAAAFLTGAFLVAVLSPVVVSSDFLGVAFFTGFGSAGCSARTKPSRWARTRTRSACCSIIVDD